MSKLADLRGRVNAASTELSALAQKDERSADEESRLDALLAELNDLGPQLQREIAIDTAAQAARKNGESRGRVAGTLPTEGAEERESQKRDTRSLGQRFAESDQVREYLPMAGTKGTQSDPFEVGSFYHRHMVEHTPDMGPQELRALIQTGTLPADYISPQQVPGFFRGDDLQGTIRDVLINGTTTSDAIVFFRELLFTNNAAGVAQATVTHAVDEDEDDGVKPESAITFEQATAPVVTIAHWIPITRQTLQDASQLRTYVEQRLIDGLRLAESDQLLNGTGTPDLDGLLLETGVQDLSDAVYFAANPVADAGSNNENFNRVLRGKTMVRSVGRARANFAVINPADNERFLTATNANENYYGAGPYGGTNLATMWGLRIVEDENITEGTVLVGDGRMAAVWDRMQAQVIAGWINDQFIRNMLTLLAEERLALTVFRPAAFAVVELAS